MTVGSSAAACAGAATCATTTTKMAMGDEVRLEVPLLNPNCSVQVIADLGQGVTEATDAARLAGVGSGEASKSADDVVHLG